VHRLLALAIATGLVASPLRPAAAPEPPPKLAVILVIDQMRADYIDRFEKDWTGGLKRMVSEGAWFTHAAYPYFETFTCAGHATIATGAFPHRHGIIQNVWWDRDLSKQITCTEDPRVHDVGYGTPVRTGNSAYRLLTPTFADVMRSQKRSHVVTLSLKDRSAIMLAGHGGDAVTWMSDTVDGWMTSPVYSTAPVPVVEKFLTVNKMSADFGKTWTRLLPESRYASRDDTLGEVPPDGWTRTFPHALNGTGESADSSFLAQWERSPFADAFLGRFAAALVEGFQLGRHDTPDVLGVSFSSPDIVGHGFGPDSQEIQDMYAHLDQTLGVLFERLDALVGRGQWVAALTADHGVSRLPEVLMRDGIDSGHVNSTAIVNAVEDAMRPQLGRRTRVVALTGSDLYFAPGVYAKLQDSPGLMSSVINAIMAVPGVERVLRSDEVRGREKSSDPLVMAEALSYFNGRSGDLIVAPKPHWMINTSGVTHGSANVDDQRVPILLFGRGIQPGRYDQSATPADVAPTLATLCGITLPQAEGRPLTVALQ
jgi:predicted AlkP superfamily pyrophosphatase or phosphodiesterase